MSWVRNMNFRLANMQDLPQLKATYREVIDRMNRNQIQIWDDVYPCAFFAEDISNQHLYVLSKDDVIISAFALCETNSGEKAVRWENPNGRVLYLDRFAVSPNYSGKGIGSFMLEKARELARAKGAEYLRLFVVDINQPAINLYKKCGFAPAEGIYREAIDRDLVLCELGYEIRLY